MQMVVHAGDVLHVVEHLGDVVAHDDDGALLVDLLQHLVHLFLESSVDVGVGFVEDDNVWLGDDGTSEEHTLELSTAQSTDMTVFQVGELHTVEGVEYLLVLCLGVSRKETFGLAES